MRLTTTLFLGAATLALASFCATAQPLRTAAAEPAVAPAKAPATAAAFTQAPAARTAPTTVATATPAPASAAAATPAPAPAAPVLGDNDNNGIAATVGETSVSDFELDQRVALFFATAGFKPNADDVKRARKIQLENLIDEHIQIAAAAKRHVTVSPVEIDKTLEELAKRQGVTIKVLADTLAKAGANIEELRNQQKVAIAWHKVLMGEFGDSVVASPAMVKDALRRAAEGATKTHYHVIEIFLPVDSPEKNDEVKKQIEDIENKIRTQQAPFRNLAQQYSRNPSAAAGGDMGWIYDGQLDPDLNAALAGMHSGELGHPVRAKGGWYLLGVQERQEGLGTNVVEAPPPPSSPPGTLPLARMLLPTPANAPPEVWDGTLKAAAQIRDAAFSCERLEEMSKDAQLKGVIFMNALQFAKLVNPDAREGYVKLADVSAEMQKALENTKYGDVAAPFRSPAGVEIIARCDPRPPPPRTPFKLPTSEDVESDIFQEQMSAMARRFMRDLRRDANVQQRDDNAVLDAALIP